MTTLEDFLATCEGIARNAAWLGRHATEGWGTIGGGKGDQQTSLMIDGTMFELQQQIIDLADIRWGRKKN